MTTSKWWGIAAVVLSIALVAGCGSKPTTNAGQPEQPTTEQPAAEQPATNDQKDNKQEQSIQVYVSDDDLMELKTYEKKIQFANDEEKYKAVLEALQSSDNDNDTPLWKKIEFKSVKMDNGTLVIDVHIPEDGHLGAGGEQFALEALTKTLFQFDEVKAIDVLVDGKAEESLMGHVTLEHPIKR
ncbi:GerMN domain-containing protein [Paenibacillus apiarius]|uniref:GerMN domain-containing protein n=1 Tax=Paenibacillus apiarius TaxID=46240 RepID=UPI003B3A2DD3